MMIASLPALFTAFTLCALAALAMPTAAIASATVIRPASEIRIGTSEVATDAGRGAQSSNSIMGSSERPCCLVILFHGIKGRGSVMEAIAASWQAALPDIEFVAPDAPFAHRSGGREWFAVDEQVMRPDRIQAARRAFDDLVSDIVRREGFENALERVAFVGVSQGAIMALDAVATGRWKVGALVSFAGLLPMPPTSSSTSTPILLMHGSADRKIPSAASVAAQRQLTSAGYDVTLKTFPDVGHTISSDEARQAEAFLRERLH